MTNAVAIDQSSSNGAAGLVASAIVGVLLGGAFAFAAASLSDNTQLPTEEQIAITSENAFLGSTQYGSRDFQ